MQKIPLKLNFWIFWSEFWQNIWVSWIFRDLSFGLGAQKKPLPWLCMHKVFELLTVWPLVGRWLRAVPACSWPGSSSAVPGPRTRRRPPRPRCRTTRTTWLGSSPGSTCPTPAETRARSSCKKVRVSSFIFSKEPTLASKIATFGATLMQIWASKPPLICQI